MNCPKCGTELKESKFAKPKGPKMYCPSKCKGPKGYPISEWDVKAEDGKTSPAPGTAKTATERVYTAATLNFIPGARDASIERQVCLKAAVEIVTAMIAAKQPVDEPDTMAMAFAESFYAKMFAPKSA